MKLRWFFRFFEEETDSRISLTVDLEEETFEGCVDKDGNGYGILHSFYNEGYTREGAFENGYLRGEVREGVTKENFELVHYSFGRKFGRFRKFRGDQYFLSLGKYLRNKRIYPLWNRMSGNSYMIYTSESEFVYLYPNSGSAIVGTHARDKVISGKAYGYLMKLDFKEEIPVPEIDIKTTLNMAYDPSNRVRISRMPLERDPYENETVYVSQSTIGSNAGEGLFAKRCIPSGSLVCLFNGVRIPKEGRCCRIKPTDDDWSDYRLTLDKSFDLDIPPDMISLKNYAATLGHKACHSFERKNAVFENLYHPRFGEIMSIISTRDINVNEEIFLNYNYEIPLSPDWYKDLWSEYRESSVL